MVLGLYFNKTDYTISRGVEFLFIYIISSKLVEYSKYISRAHSFQDVKLVRARSILRVCKKLVTIKNLKK